MTHYLVGLNWLPTGWLKHPLIDPQYLVSFFVIANKTELIKRESVAVELPHESAIICEHASEYAIQEKVYLLLLILVDCC